MKPRDSRLDLCFVSLIIFPYERDSEAILSQTSDGCARAVAFCVNPDQTITETDNIQFNQRYKSCNALGSNFCKQYFIAILYCMRLYSVTEPQWPFGYGQYWYINWYMVNIYGQHIPYIIYDICYGSYDIWYTVYVR